MWQNVYEYETIKRQDFFSLLLILIIVRIQIHLKLVKKSIKFPLEFLIFRMIRLGGYIALNLLYIIE